MATVDNTFERTAAPPRRLAAVRLGKWGRRLAVPIGWTWVIAAWAVAAEVIASPIILPAPFDVAERIWQLVTQEDAFSHFVVSLRQMLIGFVISMIVGCAIGVASGRNRYANAFFHSPVVMLGNIPAIIYAVLGLIIFGIGPAGPMFAVVLAVMPYIAIEVAVGTREVDDDLLRMSSAYERSRLQVIRHVVVPSVMPFLFTATRASFAVAWKVATLTELFGGSEGVGVMIRQSYEAFSIVDVMAWLLLFALFMLAIERVLLQRTEGFLFRWRGGTT